MDPASAARSYYDAFRNRTDFAEVPLADDLVFRAPTMELRGASQFRPVVSQLAQRLQGLEVRHQLCTEDTVVTVYDFDLGLPDGPVPMAEVLAVRAGQVAEIELLFDSRRLAGGAS